MRRKKNCYRPYGGRRKPLWLNILLAVVLAAAIAFAALEAAVLTGADVPGEELLTLLDSMKDLKLRDLYLTADGDLTFTSNGLDELTVTQPEK